MASTLHRIIVGLLLVGFLVMTIKANESGHKINYDKEHSNYGNMHHITE